MPRFKLPNLSDKRTQLVAGGAGAVVVFALYKRSKAAKSSPSSVPAGSSVTDPLASAAFGTAAIENDVYGSLLPQIEALQRQIAGLKVGNPAPKPPVPPKPPTQPGKQGGPVKPSPWPGARIDPNLFPRALVLNQLPAGDLTTLGTVGPGGLFTGHNVAGGAPVYAVLGPYGTAVQGFDAKELAPGTRLVTPSIFKSLISGATVQEKL